MVATGITVLMAASEENLSSKTDGATAHLVNQNTCSQNSEIQHYGQKSIESLIKKDVTTCSSNIIEKKQCSLTTEKNNKIISKIEPKESTKNCSICKTAQIRETRTSRLRAASKMLPNEIDVTLSKKCGSETPGSQKHNSSAKQKNSTSLDNSVTVNPVKERDKSYKRKSYLNRSRPIEVVSINHASDADYNERRFRRQSNKQSQVSEIASSVDSCSNRQMTIASPRRRYIDLKVTEAQCSNMKNLSKTSSSSSIASTTNTKRSTIQQPSSDDSEVSRKVDVLTALTRATMERVERLASAGTNCTNRTNEKVSMSPKKYTASRHAPVSILKHKTIDGEGSERQTSSCSNSSHVPSPVTFSSSIVESASHKRHGILKKRSSLDESEILRRRSCSPDVFFADNIYSEFRPILKNQRRSSLDEIIKRDQSPDQQPASILKRKSSREDDREVHQLPLGSPEPQSILKRKLANSVRANSVSHHVTIVSDVANTNATGSTSANMTANLVSDSLEGSEVRPILKKKYGKEELTGGDVSSLEPRPILKKKSSTESDEHEHDRPKKTILKSSRKNSYEEGGYETESTSPRKLSALKNRATEIESVRPILKQSSRYHDDTNSFLRKRAQSVGHARSMNDNDCVESIRALAKRRSLESSSPIDVLYTPTIASRSLTTDLPNVCDNSYAENSFTIEDGKPSCGKSCQSKQTHMNMEEKTKTDSSVYFLKLDDANIDSRDTIEILTRTVDKKEIARDKEGRRDTQENYATVHCSSVSKMTQHFKTLQEKVGSSTAAENESQRKTLQKSSRGVQRYRERKIQGGERFNTQPVTSQEVREAVLQNQRNTALGVSGLVDEPEPSKLSLAERVRFFNQKIAATDAAPHQERFTQKKRLAARYKTQPVTSEEVEVASRISPLNVDYQTQTLIGEHSKEYERPLHISSIVSTSSQHDLPKGILKSSIGHTKNQCIKTPELQTIDKSVKLIRPVLKRESEESEQPAILPNSEVYLRSILKTNLNSRATNDAATSRSEGSSSDIESQTQSDETAKFCERLDNSDITKHSLQCLCDDARTTVVKKSDNVESRATVPSHKTAILRNERNLSNDTNNYQIDTVSSKIIKRCNDKRHNNLSMDESNKTSDVYDDKDDDNDDDDDEKEKLEGTLAEQKDDGDLNDASLSSNEHKADEKQTNVTRCSNSSKNANQPCRSATQVITSIETSEKPSVSIADRLAALRHCGNTSWRQRVGDGKINEDNLPSSSEENAAIKSGVLAECMEKLESSMESWKSRIVTPDAINFTVAGKMKVVRSKDDNSSFLTESTTTNILNQKKKIPRPQRFKTKKGAISTPSSPCKDLLSSTMPTSFSEPASDDSGEECKTECILVPTVSVLKTDDETFTSFFSGISLEKCENEYLNLDETDFDTITPHSKLSVQKRNIQMQRRRAASRNPLKVLAARTDLRTEYTEIRTDIARTMRNLNVETTNSSFSIEALAGLASTEDFSSVTLKNVSETSVVTNKLQPYKDLMLILVKGRRHVQARLVEPVAESINSGDNFILVTKSEIFNYIGKYSNVIEKTRAAEITLSIQQRKDLGCRATKVISINEDKLNCTRDQVQRFWNYLGVLNGEKFNVVEAGNPDEDELYESAIIDTNMVYELKNEQLVPHEKFWGTLPKIDMLNKNKILVFDFGTEMYIWSGKGVTTDKKKLATRLATEMWNDGYDYSECTACPINATRIIGNRKSASSSEKKSAKSRPDWCLLAKLTQHVETILFREKFLDWPNVSSVTKARGRKDRTTIDGVVTMHVDDNDDMWSNNTPVDFILEGCHLGRGTGCYDNELKKDYIVATTSVMVWHIDEFSHTLLDKSSIGQFYSGDSYIIQWIYSVTITGRELTGLPSKHLAKGRDRSVSFIWQGRNASLNERGAAALLTVELDNDRGPQIRVVQGHEPAAFLNLFSGKMVIHSGKKSEKKHEKQRRLYICRGTLDSETFLIEISCSTRQLRSRGSFILLDTENAKIYVWHGNNSLRHVRENAIKAANKLKENRPEEAGLSNKNIEICEIQEGLEPEEFSNALGGMNKKLYWSLETSEIQDHTPKLYHLSSISKTFRATEILCPHRTSDLTTPFPFLQDELYQANQPALFLLDDKNVIWIWQGWWPDNGTEDQSGSKTVRWQAERRAAMTIAIRYWQKTRNTQTTNLPIYLVWAGLEPLQFINLFPEWIYRDDVAELNIEDGRNPGEVLTAEDELARLTQSIYPPAQLLQRPLPDGVDPTHLELYLSQQHFQELLGMSKEEFQQLPNWKQVNLKKEIGLF
ncbi:supervillin-like isoform X2 [Nylanderia fulva]|uniref:supervillin-like isoform X2 n=1 Tax=Nylanderia fulva TaxID=613905 RepID=UPI0010FB1308|nr:supervillin-like isoform X2 [Nylanderia fulva]